jgi:signal transduction histidine kinase/CheY-like chemotaxis protein
MRPPSIRLPSSRAALPWLIGLSALASLCCLGFALNLGLAAKRDAAASATREMAGLADGLTRQIESDVAVFDLALRDAASQMRLLPRHDASQTLARVTLPEHPLTTRQIGFMNVLNEVGDVIADSRSNVSRPVNFAGRDYFQDQLKNPTDTLLIGRPFATAPNQRAAIPLSRRLQNPDGSFAGVVVAGVQLIWLRELLSHLPPGTHTSATIRREDGTILMRSPFDADAIGRVGDAGPAWQAWLRTGISPAGDDSGGIRLFRRTGGIPLIFEIALDRADIGAEGRSWLIWLPLLPLIPGLFALVLAFAAHNLQRRCDRIEAAARRANDERMRLLATMSHELRTPLSGILGQAELLRGEGELNERQTARLSRLAAAGSSMRDIVNRVIDISRPEDHVITPVLAPCDLDILIRTCRGTVETFARAKGLDLTARVDPSAPKYASLDHGLVEQVLVNLLMNAVNFTMSGSVELRLTSEGERLRFTVADTGPGVPASKRHRLFREYDRLDTKDSRAVGTGLGLWITETIVSRLGGRIGHLDNPGGGSVFWFELPFVAAGAREQTGMEPAELPSQADRHLRILLADDMDVTRAVTADFLRAAGHSVIEVPDGEAATREAQVRDFDVILTDMRMPVVDGLEATRRIRAIPGHRGRTPVVLVTADLAARDRGVSGQAGIDHCLMKPFTRAELLETVRTAARLTPVPDADASDSPVLDESILAQLRDSLGEATVDAHFRAAAGRIEALLVLLERPDASQDQTVRHAVHDLVGIAGMMGLTALSVCLTRFDIASDRVAPGEALREVAAETVLVLHRRLPLPEEV